MFGLFRFSLLPILLVLSLSSLAQRSPGNDGFQRRDGTMYRIRNGEQRAMNHDVHLPNGRTITRDGFVVDATGRRTELAEGKGCTLLGAPTAVVTTAAGLTLASPASAVPATSRYEADLLDRVFGPRGRGKGWGRYKKHGKWKRDKDDD
ncbi:DUF6799 domain-containing protein [Hymenobacter fastidiosus]